MNTIKIYFEVFNKLNELYFSNKEKYDSFGILLGQMSPDIFSDSCSADSAWFIDFSKKLKLKNKNTPTVWDGLDVIYEMILEYNNESYNIKAFVDDYKKLWRQRYEIKNPDASEKDINKAWKEHENEITYV